MREAFIYIKDVYLEEFSSLFMEAEKFHNLLPIMYKARKASGIIQSQSEVLCASGPTIPVMRKKHRARIKNINKITVDCFTFHK